MADAFSHVLTAQVSGRWMERPQDRIILFLGVITPDLVEKCLIYVVRTPVHFATASHSIVGIVLICYVLSFLFTESIRERVCALLIAGSLVHVCLDILKDSFVAYSEYPFFPLWDGGVQVGVYRPENIVYAIPFEIIIFVIVEYFYRKKRNREMF